VDAIELVGLLQRQHVLEVQDADDVV